MSGYSKLNHFDEDEILVDIIRIEKVKKEYGYKAMALIVILMGGGIVLSMFTNSTEALVDALFTVDSEVDSIFNNLGLGMVITGFIFMVFCIVKPTWLKIGEVEYEKTTITTEREYKEFKELK